MGENVRKAGEAGRAEHIFALAAYGESPYLELQIQALRAQTVPSEILLCSATENPQLHTLAARYGLPLLLRQGEPNLRDDWNFAYEEGRKRARLVTIAHQDDLYYSNYTAELLRAYREFPDMSVFCCRYDTIDGAGRRIPGKAEWVKRLLRFRLRNRSRADQTAVKRSALLFGNGIGCPTCTYNSVLCGAPLFRNDYRFIIDWDTLLRLSALPGRFICVEKPLMAYRVHAGAETMQQMKSHNREREEEEEFRKLHGPLLAKLLLRLYRSSYSAYRRKGGIGEG